MKTHQAVTRCRHCRQEMGFAITTIGTRRSKIFVTLYCEACGLRQQGIWDSNPEQTEDPNQVKMFPQNVE